MSAVHGKPLKDGSVQITEVTWGNPGGSIPHWLLNQLALAQKGRMKVLQAIWEKIAKEL